MKLSHLFLGLFLVSSMLGCTSFNSASDDPPPMNDIGSFAEQPVQISNRASLQDGDLAQPRQNRIVIMSADMTLTVDDPAETTQAVGSMTENFGGWIVNSSISNGTNTTASIVVRVPSDQFDNALEQIRAMALAIDYEVISGQDVTQEYVDLNSQLTNLRVAEEQLQTIMESAVTTEDVLAIYNQLVSIRGEIETTEGRIQFFDESVAFSAITLTLRTESQDNTSEGSDWHPSDTIEDAFDTLVSILRVLVDLVIQLIIIGLPLLLFFGVSFYMIRYLARRWNISFPTAPSSKNNIDIIEQINMDEEKE